MSLSQRRHPSSHDVYHSLSRRWQAGFVCEARPGDKGRMAEQPPWDEEEGAIRPPCGQIRDGAAQMGSVVRTGGSIGKFIRIVVVLYVVVLLAIVGLYGARRNAIRSDYRARAAKQAAELQAAMLDRLGVMDALYARQADVAMTLLRDGAAALGSPRTEGMADVGGKQVPVLYLGGTSLTGAHDLVDRNAAIAGGTATLFVRGPDGSFIRVSTNVRKDDGTRAVGTQLDPSGAAYASIQAGKAFRGMVDILGKPYMTVYEPMLDASGTPVGIWYVGYPVAEMDQIAGAIQGKQLFAHDFHVLLDAKERIIAQSTAMADEELRSLLSQAEGEGWQRTESMFDAWRYRVVSFVKTSDIEAMAHSESLAFLRDIGIVFGLFTLLTIYFLLSVAGINAKVGEASQRISHAGSEVVLASGQIASASRQLAEGSATGAASVEETSSTMVQTVAALRQTDEHTRAVAVLSGETADMAHAGAEQMASLNRAMQSIKVSGDSIGKIIRLIDDIAFQTNILALNAAVEAARAGASGAGFAVVADEVRNLAQRSASAASDTAGLIEQNRTASAAGLEISAQVTRMLSEIREKTRRVDELIGEIEGATREQTRGMEQIAGAIRQLEDVTQQNAAVAQESSAGTDALHAQAEVLGDVVAELNRFIRGDAV